MGKDEGMIITDEVSSIDSKDEIKTDNEEDSNISIKSRTKNIINQDDTSAIVENEKVSKTSTEKYFGAASNQTTHMLSLLLDSIVIPQLRYNKVNTDECDVNLNDGKKDIEVVKINIKEVDAASEKYPKSNVEDENIIDMEDISMCETNEEAIKEIITVNSKEDDDIFVDKIIEDNDNIREVLAISKEPLGTEVKEKADIIEAEGETNVDIKENSKTSLEETAKVKELLKISVDTKEVENINDKIELANVNESTNTKVKDEGMIITDEVSITDSKDESRNDNEGDSNISIKSRTKNIINQEDTSAIVENGKVSKTSTKEDFGATANQTTNVLSFAIDSVEITQLKYIIGTDECDVNLNDGKKDIENVKINTKEVDAASEKYPESNVEDESIINMEDISMCETNEEAIKEIITVNSKEDDDIFVDKIIEDNDNI